MSENCNMIISVGFVLLWAVIVCLESFGNVLIASFARECDHPKMIMGEHLMFQLTEE